MAASQVAPTLDGLFRPKSIAIVGASSDPDKIGGRPIRLLQQFGYGGNIYPINPRRDEVQGIAAIPSLSKVPQCPDLVVMAIPSSEVVESVRSAGALGVRHFVLFSSGFAEGGGVRGVRWQNDLASLARRCGLRFLGPNCLGYFNVHDRTYVTFTQTLDMFTPRPGAIAVAMQSGAMAAHVFVLLQRKGCGLSYMISTGNEADVRLGEIVEYLAADRHTKVIVLGVEALRDPERCIAAIQASRRAGKIVICLKLGASPSGAAAVRSHSAGLAGSAEVFANIFRSAGAVVCGSIGEAVETAAAAIRHSRNGNGRVAKSNLAIVTHSGGFGVLMADEAERAGLRLCRFSRTFRAELKALLPFGNVANPVDVTGQIINVPDVFAEVLGRIGRHKRVQSLLIFLGTLGMNPSYAAILNRAIIALRGQNPVLEIGVCSLATGAERQELIDAGIIVSEDANGLVRAIAAIDGTRTVQQDFRVRIVEAGRRAQNGDAPLEARLISLSEVEAGNLLRKAGLNVNPIKLARSKREAVRAAERIGFPVVLKAVSPCLLHKSENGAVAINIWSRSRVESTYASMARTFGKGRGRSRLDGVGIAKMISGGLEVFVGCKRDNVFGPIVLFGQGGKFVELFHDVVTDRAPITRARAVRLMQRTKIFAALEGYRSPRPFDIDAIAELIVALSRFFARDERIDSVDLNPVIARERGKGCVIVDAKIMLRKEPS